VKELEPGQKWANDKQTACYCGITIPTLLEWDDNEGFPPAVGSAARNSATLMKLTPGCVHALCVACVVSPKKQ
jgi:hypothetical protein